MDIINEFIKEYDFKSYLTNLEKDLVGDNYSQFTKEFWNTPGINILNLKSKYDIKNNISLKNILIQNPIQEYYEFLDDIWKKQINIDEIIKKYNFTLSRLEQIIFSLEYENENTYCNKCLNNKFLITKNFKDNDVIIECENCGVIVDNFINKESKEQIIAKEAEEKKKFVDMLHEVNKELNDIKCHKCQSELGIYYNLNEKEYEIKCDKCESTYNDIEGAKTQYSLWKQRAAVMANIKSKEQELLTKTLSNKSEDDIAFKLENIITEEEGLDVIKGLIDSSKKNEDIFVVLFNKYLKMNRMDRKLLVYVCRECKEKYSLTTWQINNVPMMEMALIKYDEPLIYTLMEATKLLPIRSIIRKLMKENLLYCNEHKNELEVHPSLVENIQKLESINKRQNIDNQIAYLIFNKQNYICYHCGESGRPLKIGYLTTDKNINELSNLVGICDSCYDDITEDEIVVDNIFSFIDEKSNELGKAWEFILHYDNEFRNDEIAEMEHLRLSEKYDKKNLILAYANTLYKKSKDGFVNNKLFFSYANAILENSRDNIFVKEIIKEKYRLERWLD